MALPQRYDFPLFHGIPEEEIRWLIEASSEQTLKPGDVFFREGDATNPYYIVLEGEMQVTRMMQGKQVVMGTTPRGIMGGEIPVLQRIPTNATSRAIATTTLMVFDEAAFRQMFVHAPMFAARVLQTATERITGVATMSVQQEKMAALGKLSAGLAHELNNPASSARRAADTLNELLPQLQMRTLRLSELGMTKEQLQELIRLNREVIGHIGAAPVLSPMEQADREDELADMMEEAGIENAWDLAPIFVSAGIQTEQARAFIASLPPDGVQDILDWAHTAINAAFLVDEIESAATRISELVGAVKSYTYMDRAPTQEVDLNQNLITTLKVMHYKLKDVEVSKHFDPSLPPIVGRGGELNQVFTNIIDNAVDAMASNDGPQRLELITRCEDEFTMVEITDNGPGIPEDVLPRIFEPFFTTKDVGKGTGMGLELSYRIVQEHSGTIEVQSEPGRTRFIIRLPLENDLVTE